MGYNLQWDTIFKPFGKTIWYAVIVWLFLGSAVISVCYYISFMYGIENDLDKISSPAHSFFFILQTLSQQGKNLQFPNNLKSINWKKFCRVPCSPQVGLLQNVVLSVVPAIRDPNSILLRFSHILSHSASSVPTVQ